MTTMSEMTETRQRAMHANTAELQEPSLSTPASIRVSPNSYLITLVLGTFFAALSFYLRFDTAGFVLFIVSWVLLPFFALNDHIAFDGKRLTRTGLIPRLWSWFTATRHRLKLSDIEQVDTQAVRALKRAGNVYYRYRTTIRGKEMQVAFASGGEDYRRMISAILPRLSPDVMDTRSIELREHLADPKETLMKAEFEHIPGPEVLRQSADPAGRRRSPLPQTAGGDPARADYLRSLANELRLNGYLLQALEAFRRALVIKPRDGRLLFEFARCLQSFAGSERSPELERKAIAVMRLAERRAGEDGDLLERLGETYFQAGEWKRAARVFKKALGSVGEGFRSARGLAEIALREGKIAHVIHHFSTANRLAGTASLRRWTSSEAEYFSRLNDDDEYMEMEISRVNLLETLEKASRTSLRIAFLGFPAIFIGVFGDDSLVADIGWAVSTVSLLIWAGLLITSRMLSPRIPYELLDADE